MAAHSYESLAQAYFVLFVYYPVWIAWWLVRLPFALWFSSLLWLAHTAQATVLFAVRGWIWVVGWPLRRVGLLPWTSVSSPGSPVGEAPVYDACKSYDKMQAYVLLLDEFDASAVASTPFSTKTVEKWLASQSSTKETSAAALDPAVKTPSKKSKKSPKPKKKGSQKERRPSLHPEHLTFLDLNGPEGWLRFYSNDTMQIPKGPSMLNIRDYEVDLYPCTLLYNRFFSRTYPLRLRLKNEDAPTTDTTATSSTRKEYFLLFTTGMEKERWFLALRKATMRPTTVEGQSTFQAREAFLLRQIVDSHRQSHPNEYGPPLPAKDGQTLLHSRWKKKNKQLMEKQTIVPWKEDSFDDLKQTAGVDTRWLNLLLGRMWLSMCDKRRLYDLIISKVMRKISRVKRPTFLGEIKVQQLESGKSLPMFNNARIVQASEYGDVHVEFDLLYQGALRLVIETRATMDLVKSMAVDIVVAVSIEEIRGKLSVRTNPLPSSRIWWGFSEEPQLKVTMTPLVADTNVGFNMVRDVFEKKIKSSLREALVYPNMEDLCIFGCESSHVTWSIHDQPVDTVDTVLVNTTSEEQLTPHPSVAGFVSAATTPQRSGAATPISPSSMIQPRLSLSQASPPPVLGKTPSSLLLTPRALLSTPSNLSLNPFQGISAYWSGAGTPLSSKRGSADSTQTTSPAVPPKDSLQTTRGGVATVEEQPEDNAVE